MKKKIVVIGGGNGSSIVLNAIKPFSNDLEISAVITTSDSGYSSGAFRKQYKTLPPGDIMRAVLALSPYDFETLKQIFYRNRLSGLSLLNADLKASRGPNLGNIF